jgi:very-short-patch-repair endonuclease
MVDRARDLREQETPPEELLWLAVRADPIGTEKYEVE